MHESGGRMYRHTFVQMLQQKKLDRKCADGQTDTDAHPKKVHSVGMSGVGAVAQ